MSEGEKVDESKWPSHFVEVDGLFAAAFGAYFECGCIVGVDVSFGRVSASVAVLGVFVPDDDVVDHWP
jgi:hypothetical protein